MTAQITLIDVGLAATIIFGIGIAILCIAGLIGWLTLRDHDKIGPLAKAEQEHRIEQHRVDSVLKAKHAQAEIALADAKIIEAQASVAAAQARTTEAELERLDRQLTRGSGQ